MHYSSVGEGNKQELCFVPPAIGQSIIGRDFLGVTPGNFFFGGGGEVCKNVLNLLLIFRQVNTNTRTAGRFYVVRKKSLGAQLVKTVRISEQY